MQEKLLELVLELVKSNTKQSENPKSKKYRLNVGDKVCFRTVTMIYTGEIVEIQDDCFVILKAAWIPETLRWNESVRTGYFKEVEPYPDELPVFISRGALLDCFLIPTLPRVVK